MALSFELTEEQLQLKDTCRRLAEEFEQGALERDIERRTPVEHFERMREAGLYGIVVPKELGGMGGGALEWVLAAEEIAARDAVTAVGFNMHINATGGIINRHEEIPAERKRWVAELATSEGKLFCTSVSEPATSSLLPGSYSPALAARRVDGGWTLHGRKLFASIFESADYCYLYAHPEGSPNPMHQLGLVVDTKQDGIEIEDVWDTHGMRATRSNMVVYDGAFVPDDFVLYETETFLESFIIEEAGYAFGGYVACYLGIAQGIVDWAKQFLGSRKAKGQAQEMGYHPSISSRVGLMVTEVEAARGVVYRAAWETDVNGPTPEAFNRWIQAKLIVGETMQRVANLAVLAGGAHGLFRKEGLELKLRDGATAPIMPPNSAAASEMAGLIAMGLDPQQAPTLRPAEPEPAAAS
jgi:alkylation response protein AidB-like acyl-CoA dehydrogenase